MIQLYIMYFAWFGMFIAWVSQYTAYKAKCKECDALWKILRARDMVGERVKSWGKEATQPKA